MSWCGNTGSLAARMRSASEKARVARHDQHEGAQHHIADHARRDDGGAGRHLKSLERAIQLVGSLPWGISPPKRAERGRRFHAAEPVQAQSGKAAKRRASATAAKHAGAIAFSRTGDPDMARTDSIAATGEPELSAIRS